MTVSARPPMVSREGTPSPDEIQRVRIHECRMSGHTFEEIVRLGSLDPVLLACSNCGRQWTVGAGSGGAS